MEFFLLYLFISIEKIAAFLAIGSSIFTWSIVVYIGTHILNFALSKDADSYKAFKDKTKKHRKVAVLLGVVGAMLFTVSSLLPTKKELAVIVAGGVTYNVITSDSAKEIGGKAIELLKKQIDDALKDDVINNSVNSLKEQAIEKAKQEARKQINA